METFLRSRSVVDPCALIEEAPSGLYVPERAPRSRELLGSYFDLEAKSGPLHAQCTADVGLRLVSDMPIPVYQTAPSRLLREALKAEQPEQVNPNVPHDLPSDMRSISWKRLCVMIDNWGKLSTADRSRVVISLGKLGFWKSVVDLVPVGEMGSSLDSLRMAYFRYFAEAQLAPDPLTATAALVGARIANECIARHEDFDLTVRHAAAAHMIVLHAKDKNSKVVANMRFWLRFANNLATAANSEVDPLCASVYWRAVAFIPFFEKDHYEVDRCLKLAESSAMEAVEYADSAGRLQALENVHPLLETSGRSAKARGDKEGAEKFYTRMLEWDPLDPRGHIRLADFLKSEGRVSEALKRYRSAADLGAPYSTYAHYQAARCWIELDRSERAHGALVASASIDRRALSPLILLRDICTTEKLRPLRDWATNGLAARMGAENKHT